MTDNKPTFPTRPRFTLDTLREVRIANGTGENTIAGYTYTHGGKLYTRYNQLEDLTAGERKDLLAFILKYSPAVTIRRKQKPRGKNAPPKAAAPAPAGTPPDGLTIAPLDIELGDVDPLGVLDKLELDPLGVLDKLEIDPLNMIDNIDPRTVETADNGGGNYYQPMP